jgi:hypothetical protein
MLQASNLFKSNLELIRSHLHDCRLQTDRVLAEIAAPSGGAKASGHVYQRYSDVEAFIKANRPTVRSK